MWVYHQKTGALHDKTGQCVAHGYAGNGEGKNNPEAQARHDVGPLPRGLYTIDPPYDSPRVGPYALPLLPHADNEMFGRGDFRMHGDSKDKPGTASHGCIIQSRTVREQVWSSGDRLLEVVI